MQVYKILRAEEWAAFDAAGVFGGSLDDERDGYIHLSTKAQVAGTHAKYFAGATGLMLVALDAAALGAALRWEEARGGMRFPHLYRALAYADIVDVSPLPPLAPA